MQNQGFEGSDVAENHKSMLSEILKGVPNSKQISLFFDFPWTSRLKPKLQKTCLFGVRTQYVILHSPA